MKRILLSVFILIILAICTLSSHPAQTDESIGSKWDDASAILPSTLTSKPEPEPTITPTPMQEYVTQKNLSLSLDFGDYTGSYTGWLQDGLPNGKGRFTTTNENGMGWMYEGAWKNGHFYGSGTVTWEDGFVSSGIYRNDFLNGEGNESLYGATLYRGSYRNGYYHGQGTLFNQHGDVIYSGPFYYGLISETPDERSARIDAFKILCASPSVQTLYKSCKNGTKQCGKISGTIFDIFYDNIESPTYCDFLIYERNKSDAKHIVCVIYTLSEGEEPPAEGQTVTIWGTTEYLYSYTSTDSDDLTVPLIKAYCVEADS